MNFNNLLLIIVLVLGLGLVLMCVCGCGSTLSTPTNEDYDNLYSYSIPSGKSQNLNLQTFNPYKMPINESTSDKIFTNTRFGSNDEPSFLSNIGVYYNTNTYQPIVKLENELNAKNLLEKVNPHVPQGDLAYSNGKTYCGGLGNICSNDTDCCKGVHCLNNICKQV